MTIHSRIVIEMNDSIFILIRKDLVSQKRYVIDEKYLARRKEEIEKLTEQLNKPSNVTIQQNSRPLIYDIDLEISSKLI